MFLLVVVAAMAKMASVDGLLHEVNLLVVEEVDQ